MNSNIIQCEETFSNFYHYGNHKSESEKKIVQSFKSDFEKMSIVDSFQDYINTEIPKFNPQWLTEDFQDANADHQMLDRINETLIKLEINFKRKTTMYLPDLKQNKNPAKSIRTSNQFSVADEQKASEFLDKQQLETDFYIGLKKDIDKILLNAWDGKEDLTEDELRRFREIMRYKQG